MTKNEFLAGYRVALLAAGYAWTRDEAKLSRFLRNVARTIQHPNAPPDTTGETRQWQHKSEAGLAAWRGLGGKAKDYTLKNLIALPVSKE